MNGKRNCNYKRFYKDTRQVYFYRLQNHSAGTAFHFLQEIEKRIDFIHRYPETGKPSHKKEKYKECDTRAIQ